MSAAVPPRKFDWRQWRVRGQGLVEYALILVAVAILIIVVLTWVGQIVFVEMYSTISSSMP